MKLYSTLDRKIVEIQPNRSGEIKMYNCGPTVYSKMQIGNLRSYINWDVLYRALGYLGFKVERVMNMTDVGHMTHDEDFGEDKVDKKALESGKEPIEIADEYIKTVLEDFSKLNILAPNGEEVDPTWDVHNLDEKGFTRATEYVDRMIEIIKKMEQNGYTYETDQALYFDVTKIPDYTIFTGQDLSEKEVGVREEVGVDQNKKHPADFVLWMKRTGKYENHIMHWDSPWGDGFPGWHIECSAMSTAKLGENLDIHTGGMDNSTTHHPNERAQNIGAFGQPVVKYWIHNEWLVNAEGGKLSKSDGGITLQELIDNGYEPMDLRYWVLSATFRVQMKLSDEALDGARNARLNLINKLRFVDGPLGKILKEYKKRFEEAIGDNLNTPKGLAILNEMLKSPEKEEDIFATALDFDKVLGLNLKESVGENYSVEKELEANELVRNLVEKRRMAKKEKDFEESDRLRDEISNLGYDVLDTPEGQQLKKK